MQKTIDITLAGTRFTLEERAYERLVAYTTSLETHFTANAEKTEILRDIEARIAEQFLANRNSGNDVVTDTEVTAIMHDIGSVSAIAEFENDERNDRHEPAGTERSSKKLFRDTSNRVLGGVCSGLAAYFNLDSPVVRIVVLILALVFFPFSILIYILMWMIVPAARTPVQKLKMQGEPVTVARIQAYHEGQKDDARQSANVFTKVLLVIVGIVVFCLLLAFGFLGMFRVSHVETGPAPDWGTFEVTGDEGTAEVNFN